MSSAVICLADTLNAFLTDRYSALTVPSDMHKMLLLDGTREHPSQHDWGLKFEEFSFADLISKGFCPIAKRLLPGSNHFPVVDWMSRNSYEFAWCVESDVVFNGSWHTFFSDQQTSEADFLAAYICTRVDLPKWHWWDTLKSPNGTQPQLTADQLYKSFNPVYRLSRRAALYLKRFYQAGWMGHHEVSMPTLLTLGGYCVEDFGGTGRFVQPHNYGRWYSPETYSHRAPTIASIDQQNCGLLFHPIKGPKV